MLRGRHCLPKQLSSRELDLVSKGHNVNNGFIDSKVHFLRVEGLASEFELLGTSILAHLSALPGLFSRKGPIGIAPTIQGFGLLFGKPKKMSGYSNAWIGKAFEYAVADLFNRQSEPYYTLIRQGIQSALATRVSPRVGKVSLDIDRLSCIRVARDSADAEDLVEAFGRFRVLWDARRNIENIARMYPGLETKVDVIFCEREAESARRFAVLASLKVNREAFLLDKVRQDFLNFPLDLGITVETPRYTGVRVYKELEVPVVHLPMDVTSGVRAWGLATEIVKTALLEGKKGPILKFFKMFFKLDTPENFWVEFLADRPQVELRYVIQEIRQTLHQTPGERVTLVPTLLGAEEDAVLDLVIP